MASLSEEQQVKLILTAMAKAIRCDISRTQVKIYSRALADLGSEGMQRAFAQMMADPWLKPGELPLPGRIREMAQGSIEDEAQRITMRIMKARREFSSSQAAEAKEMIGLQGWEIVRAYGWSTLCNMSSDQMTTLMSQVKKAAHASVSIQRRHQAVANMIGPSGKNLAIEGILGGEIAIRGDGDSDVRNEEA